MVIETTFAERVNQFNSNLKLDIALPDGVSALNPFEENSPGKHLSTKFYQRFYNDNEPRELILGINPGRLGAGATGIPFTDTKRLLSHCNIECDFHLHEPSSVFVYEMIDAFGGAEKFYKRFLFSSVSPLGYIKINEKGRETNYNYYDNSQLQNSLMPFIIDSMRRLIALGINPKKVYCLGTGKNFKFLQNLNIDYQFFNEVIALEHPRYIMQYKSKNMSKYIQKYLDAFSSK